MAAFVVMLSSMLSRNGCASHAAPVGPKRTAPPTPVIRLATSRCGSETRESTFQRLAASWTWRYTAPRDSDHESLNEVKCKGADHV